jgi:phage tail-like protein
MPSTDDRKTPYHAFHFVIEIDGIQRGGFRECSGLDSTSDVVNYREGDDPLTIRKLVGLNKYSNITLKWGSSDDADLWNWRKKVVDGKPERKNGSVVLLDEAGQEKVRWNFKQGWPMQWTGPALNATATDVAIESLVIAHEGVEKH